MGLRERNASSAEMYYANCLQWVAGLAGDEEVVGVLVMEEKAGRVEEALEGKKSGSLGQRRLRG